MACTVKLRYDQLHMGGRREIAGCGVLDSTYATGGVNLDLSNFFKATQPVTVILSSTQGYALSHDQGTAQGGLVKVYQNVFNANTMNGAEANAYNAALYQVHEGADLSKVNFSFIATGQAY